jgi:CRISPR/Cas system-associated endonuclease Cas1
MELPTARERLQKQLQKAQKLVVFVDRSGEQFLQRIPEISVSRVVRRAKKIASQSIEQRRVQIAQRIIARHLQ